MKLRILFYSFLLILLLSCNKKVKRYTDQFSKNEIALFSSDSGDIYINFDSVKTIDEYFLTIRAFIKDAGWWKVYRPYSFLQHTDSNKNTKKTRICFAPYLYNIGAGYTRNPNETFRIRSIRKHIDYDIFRNEGFIYKQLTTDTIQFIEDISDFFYERKDMKYDYPENFETSLSGKPKRPWETKYEPSIHIEFYDSLTCVNKILCMAIKGYLSAQNKIAIEKYESPLEKLNSNQLNSLRDSLPLNIQFFRSSIKIKSKTTPSPDLQ